MIDTRSFNISMQPFTIDAKDHFDASMQFFNFQKGIGMLLIQEMKGAEKIGDAVNIRNTFEDHDKQILGKLDSIINSVENKELKESLNDLKKTIIEAEINKEGKF